MQRTLSSAQTFFTKFITPVLCLAAFCALTFIYLNTPGGLRTRSGAPIPAGLQMLFVPVLALLLAYVCWYCVRLKRVRIDPEALYISNFQTEIRVPLRDVSDVSENRWIKLHPITIRFTRETEFGNSVVFMPKARWFGGWSPHPVVAELVEAVERASRFGSGPPIVE